MSSTKNAGGAHIERIALKHGLRMAKHRSYCFKCPGLRKFGVGRGQKPQCLECLDRKDKK